MAARVARRRAAMLAPALVVTLGIAGCGNARTKPLSVYTTYPAQKFQPFGLGRYGIGFQVPANWSDLSDVLHPPVVAIVASGPSVIAVSNYARSIAPPAGDALAQTKDTLVGAIRAKQPAFKLLGSRTLSVDGAPGIEIDGVESIAGQRRRVRSVHIYLPTNEVVLQEYAPVATFDTVDRQVFSRVTRSLRLLPKTGTTSQRGATSATGVTAGTGTT